MYHCSTVFFGAAQKQGPSTPQLALNSADLSVNQAQASSGTSRVLKPPRGPRCWNRPHIWDSLTWRVTRHFFMYCEMRCHNTYLTFSLNILLPVNNGCFCIIFILLVFSFLTHSMVGISGCNNISVALLVSQSPPTPNNKPLIVSQMWSPTAGWWLPGGGGAVQNPREHHCLVVRSFCHKLQSA